MSAREIVLCQPVRTAIGGYGGALKTIPATALGATVVHETLARAGLDPAQLSCVVMGNAIQAGNRVNPARQAAIGGDVPVGVTALTVNCAFGSGAQAIVSAAQEIRAGDARFVVAGGMENTDLAPYLLEGGRWGRQVGAAHLLDSMLTDGIEDAFSGAHPGWIVERLVERQRLSRGAQDAFAARSQQRFATGLKAGWFDEEIVGVELKDRGGEIFDTDEAPRPDTTIDTLAALKPAFRNDGTITAGNAPGVDSGAAAMIVADRAAAEEAGIAPFGRLVAAGMGAVGQEMFGLGAVPAVRQALGRAGWSIGDLDRAEIDEAFAAVPLAVAAELGLSLDIVNVEGGAIAHGHPIGAIGAVLVTRLLHALRRTGQRRGLVALCLGDGQGIALALEAI